MGAKLFFICHLDMNDYDIIYYSELDTYGQFLYIFCNYLSNKFDLAWFFYQGWSRGRLFF